MSGETTTGTIIGFLRLDASAWYEELGRAKAAADELGSRNPDIHIGTNAAEVVAQLEAVDAATRQAADANGKLDRSQQNAIRSGSALVTTIVALGPALVPLAAGATGLGLAFGGMGAAGVLAIFGIKQEMAAGTVQGLQYKAALTGLQGDLTKLEQIAASGVLKPFLAIVADLHGRMPGLSRDVSSFSAVLGNAAVPTVRGLFNVFQTLLPLMQAGAVEAVHLGQAFATWSTSSGLRSFGTYAESVLPEIIGLLEQLVPAVVKLAAAFAPMGGTVVTVLTAVATAINALPIGVLQELAIVGTSAFLAFRSWTLITSIIDGTAKVLERVAGQAVLTAGAIRTLTLAAGAIGVVLAVASILWANHQSSVQAAAQSVAAYTDALRQSNGVIDENIRLMAFKALQDDGAIDAANRLGLSLSLVTDAALGQTGASRQLADQMAALAQAQAEADAGGKKTGRTMAETTSDLAVLTNGLGVNTGQFVKAQAAQRDWAAASKSSGNAAAAAASAVSKQAAAFHTTTTAMATANTEQAKVAAQAAAATVKMQLENNAAGLLKQSLDALSGKSLSAAQAQNAFEQAQVSLTSQIKSGSAAVRGNSDAAIANRGSLLGLVTAAQNSAEAYGEMRGSSEAGRQKLIELRTAIINTAVAHGMDRAAVVAYINQVLAIPRTVPPTKLQVDDAAALGTLNSFKAQLYSLNGHTVTTYVRTVASQVTAMDSGAGGVGGVGSHGMLTKANGGVVEYFAAGGFSENHVAQIAPAGVSRVWNEPETQGEAYIPLAPSKRARSLEVWQETGRRLGADGVSRLHPADIVELARALGREIARRPVVVSGSAIDQALGV